MLTLTQHVLIFWVKKQGVFINYMSQSTEARSSYLPLVYQIHCPTINAQNGHHYMFVLILAHKDE
jgi:hypothetical protein